MEEEVKWHSKRKYPCKKLKDGELEDLIKLVDDTTLELDI